MKKSFLKRVTAAVVAVPVALTQTALFTSFAAGETTDAAASTTKSYTVEDLIAVKADAELIAKDNFVSKANTKFTADELNTSDKYTFVQRSSWNQAVSGLLYSRSGNVYDLTAQKAQIASVIKNDDSIKGILKNAINDEKSTITAEVDGTDVIVTVNFDYTYSQDLAKLMTTAMNKSIAKKYDDVSVTVEQGALTKLTPIKGKIVMTADASKLAADNTADFAATVIFDDAEKKGFKAVEDYVAEEIGKSIAAMKADAALAVENEIVAKNAALNEAEANLEKVKAEADEQKVAEAEKAVEAAKLAYKHAVDLREENLQSYADNLSTQFARYKNKVDSYDNKTVDVEIQNAKNIDEVLAKVDKKFAKAPASVDAIKNGKFYNTFVNLFNEVIKVANESSNETIAITVDDVLNTVQSAYNIDAVVKGTATTYTAEGETLFYVPDAITAKDKDVIIEKLNNSKELLTANKQVDADTLKTVKVVEALGNAAAGLEFKGSAALDIYRVINFDVKDKETTTESTTTDTTTSTTTTVSEETTASTTTTEESTISSTTTEESTSAVESTTEEETTTEAETTTESTTTNTTTTTVSEETTASTTSSSTTATTAGSTESSTETTKETTGSTTKSTKVAGEVEMNVTVKTVPAAGAGFYYAHDENAFDTDQLLDKPAESPELNEAVVAANFTLGTETGSAGATFSPKALFADAKGYVVADLNVYYQYGDTVLKVVDADRKPVTVKVYVGVKGDIDEDGICNANDATRALIHAAQVGTTEAGKELPKLSAFEGIQVPAAATDADLFEKFMVFLGDTNTESSTGEDVNNEDTTKRVAVNAADATNMLVYAAKVGTNPKDGEEGHKTVTDLWADLLPADKMPAYSAKITNAAKKA